MKLVHGGLLNSIGDFEMTAPETIVGLGEVLWDVFPDGARFGGAPANFACSVAGVGGDVVHVCMVSAVGTDELGQRALLELKQRHVDVSFVPQQNRPTGQVLVRFDGANHCRSLERQPINVDVRRFKHQCSNHKMQVLLPSVRGTP